MAAEMVEQDGKHGSPPKSRTNSFYGDGFGSEVCMKFVHEGDIRVREVPEELSSFSQIVDMAVNALEILPKKFGKGAPFRKAVYFMYKDEDGDDICCKQLEDLKAALTYIRGLGGRRLRLQVCIDQTAMNEGGDNNEEQGNAKENDSKPEESGEIKGTLAEQAAVGEERDEEKSSPGQAYPTDCTAPTKELRQGSGKKDTGKDAFGAARRLLELLDLLNFVDDSELENFVGNIYEKKHIINCFADVLLHMEQLVTGQTSSVYQWMYTVESTHEFQVLEQCFCKLRKRIQIKPSADLNESVTGLYKRLMNAGAFMRHQDGILLSRLMQVIDLVESASRDYSSALLRSTFQGLAKFLDVRLRTIESSTANTLHFELQQRDQTLTAAYRSKATARFSVINKAQTTTSEYIPLYLYHRDGRNIVTDNLTPVSHIPPLNPEQMYSIDVTLDSSQSGTSVYEVWAGSDTHVGDLTLYLSPPEAGEEVSKLKIMNQPSAPLSLTPGERFRYHFTITNSSNVALKEAQEIYFQRLSGEELTEEDSYGCIVPQLTPWQSYDALLLLRAPGVPGRSYQTCYNVALADGTSIGELSIKINTNNTNAHNVFNDESHANQGEIARELHRQFDGLELDTIESILESCGGNRENAKELLHQVSCS